MKEVDITIGCFFSYPVYVELDMLEESAVALGSGEAVAVLDYFKVTTGGVVKAAAYVTGYPSVFWFVPDLRFIRQV